MADRYFDQVLEGTAVWSDIEDFVTAWHESDTTEPVYEFLGLSEDDYGLWVERPDALRVILTAKKRDESVVDLLDTADDMALAARGLDPEEAHNVRRWLQETGRLPKK